MPEPIPLKAVKNEPDENIVAHLEELLAQAKEGRIIGIAIASNMVNDTTETTLETWGGSHVIRLVGALEALKHRLLVRLHED
jgi:beta-phosphoglucomutase-like phosphatase (HAD superfamily)